MPVIVERGGTHKEVPRYPGAPRDGDDGGWGRAGGGQPHPPGGCWDLEEGPLRGGEGGGEAADPGLGGGCAKPRLAPSSPAPAPRRPGAAEGGRPPALGSGSEEKPGGLREPRIAINSASAPANPRH